MKFIKAGNNYISDIIRLRFAYLEEDYNGLDQQVREQIKAQLPEYFEKHLNQDFFSYLAVKSGIPVASVCLLVTEKPANPNFITGKTGTVVNVYTAPEYRRQGIAKKLLDMAIEDAKEWNLSYLELQATKDGETLYEKAGFNIWKSSYKHMKLKLDKM